MGYATLAVILFFAYLGLRSDRRRKLDRIRELERERDYLSGRVHELEAIISELRHGPRHLS